MVSDEHMESRIQNWRQIQNEKNLLELMEIMRALIGKGGSTVARSKIKDALCFVRFVVDRVRFNVEGTSLRALLELS